MPWRQPKRGRIEPIPRSQQFLNQMGGWATNKRHSVSKKGTYSFDFQMRLLQTPVTLAAGQSYVTQKITANGQSIYAFSLTRTFQRLRVKSFELFFNVVSTVNDPNFAYQVVVAKAKDNRGGTTHSSLYAHNIEGAQMKLFSAPSSSTNLRGNDQHDNVLRLKVFYPILNGGVGANGEVSEPFWVAQEDWNQAIWSLAYVTIDRLGSETRAHEFNIIITGKWEIMCSSPDFTT